MSRVYFHAKILLFGEYTVLNGGRALGIPFKKFKGHWKFDGSRTIDKSLHAFYKYLLENFKEEFDHANFENEIINGLRFKSDIPIGYGLGSSAALCAACFSRYFYHQEISKMDIKIIFAKMESHFHGKSSGFDPLISFTNQPVVKTLDKIEII
ncbi:MAG: mevalonate kinase, partial [Bacteroidota bacterium]